MYSMSQNPLSKFATAVSDAIATVPGSGRFGSRKVFVSAIWDALSSSNRAGLTYAEFKAQLFAAHRAELLSLARADLVAAMPTDVVAASVIEILGASFHFVIDAQARDAWA